MEGNLDAERKEKIPQSESGDSQEVLAKEYLRLHKQWSLESSVNVTIANNLNRERELAQHGDKWALEQVKRFEARFQEGLDREGELQNQMSSLFERMTDETKDRYLKSKNS